MPAANGISRIAAAIASLPAAYTYRCMRRFTLAASVLTIPAVPIVRTVVACRNGAGTTLRLFPFEALCLLFKLAEVVAGNAPILSAW